jgi:hypothetical protein
VAAVNQRLSNKLSCWDHAELRVQPGKWGQRPVCRRGTEPMSIQNAIDQIVEAFIPEMAKISKTNESEEQKERHYKAWLRATLQKFADDVREIAVRSSEKNSH